MSRFPQRGLSFDEKRKRQKKRLRLTLFIMVLIFLYALITGSLVESWILRGRSMLPSFPSGTRFIAMPWFTEASITPKRGQLVILRPGYAPPRNVFIHLLDPILRIFTFQRFSLLGGIGAYWENDRVFKRVIGLPGDTIRMENYTTYIREPGSSRFLSEFKLGSSYQIHNTPTTRSKHFGQALSGELGVRKLAHDEYFVLGDNRAASNDSRYWGPVKKSEIKGRIILFYWPISLFGLPRVR